MITLSTMGLTPRDKWDIAISLVLGVAVGLLASDSRYGTVLTWMPLLFIAVFGLGAVYRVWRRDRTVARRMHAVPEPQ